MPFTSGKSYGTRKRTGTHTRKQRSSAARNKHAILRKRSAPAQQRQLLSLQKQVVTLKKVSKQRVQYAQYFLQLKDGTGPDSAQIDLPNGTFYVNPLMRPTDWATEPVFQATTTSDEPNKCIVKSFDIQAVFSPKNSLTALTPRIVRVWTISLRKETAQETLQGTAQMTAAGLNGAPNGKYYKNTFVDGGLATMVKLNPAAFKIHHYREFTMANIMQETATPDDDVAVTNTFNALKRMRIFLKCGNHLKPPQGKWSQIAEGEVMPLDRKYLLVHVGGWDNDGDNAVRMDTNIVTTVTTTN
jgi:hypothetical protein